MTLNPPISVSVTSQNTYFMRHKMSDKELLALATKAVQMYSESHPRPVQVTNVLWGIRFAEEHYGIGREE